MRKAYFFKVFLPFLLLLVLEITSANTSSSHLPVGRLSLDESYVPNELIVRFKDGEAQQKTEQYHQSHGFETINIFRSNGARHFRLPPSIAVENALQILQNDSNVVYAEPNYYRSADVVPNDTFFDELWALRNTGQTINGVKGTEDADIDADVGWEVSTGSSNVVVAVIDSGVDIFHPDLEQNIWVNQGEIPANEVDDDGNGYVDDINGWDFISNTNIIQPNDSHGHGTHVAGTIAAVGNNGVGVAGVSWDASLMVIRYLDANGIGDTANAILAIEYANAMGAKIINNSWGGGGYSQALSDAIEASPALVICSAGNNSVDTDYAPHYPASYQSSKILSVAATDQADQLATFSNFGAVSVDIGAPGVNIYSSTPGREVVWEDDFEGGDIGGWVTGGRSDDWGLTDTIVFDGDYSLSDSPEGEYSTRTNSWCRSPAIDLSSERQSKLLFKVRGFSEPGYDKLYVEISTDNIVWTPRPIRVDGVGLLYFISGELSDWRDAIVDLGALDGAPEAYVRFSFITDWSNNYDGWYVDDVSLTAASDIYEGTEYKYLSGTSMAAPHVSGVAAIVAAINPDWSNEQIKQAILEAVDPLSYLEGVTFSGGRANLYSAATSISSSGVLQFEEGSYFAGEADGVAILVVSRTGGSEGVVELDYQSEEGSATAGRDFTTVSGTLSWIDKETATKLITVPLIDDSSLEGDETVTLRLENPTGGATLGSRDSTILTIVDDEHPMPGAIQFSEGSTSFVESEGEAAVGVVRVSGSDGEVSATCKSSSGTAEEGADYQAVDLLLTWLDGETSTQYCLVRINDDNLLEDTETVSLALSDLTGGAELGVPNVSVLTIIDNDLLYPGELNFVSSNYSVEETAGGVLVTVSRSGGSDGGVSVEYATADGSATDILDYDAVAGLLIWEDGDTDDKEFFVPVFADEIQEEDEIIKVALSSPTNGAKLGELSQATITIVDNFVPSEDDRDGDGWADNEDAFPDDPDEWKDTDGDGVGDNSDIDDDNDGFNDNEELSSGSDPHDWEDTPLGLRPNIPIINEISAHIDFPLSTFEVALGEFYDPDDTAAIAPAGIEWRVESAPTGEDVCRVVFWFTAVSSVLDFPVGLFDPGENYSFIARYFDSAGLASGWSEPHLVAMGEDPKDSNGDGVEDRAFVDGETELEPDDGVVIFRDPESNEHIGIAPAAGRIERLYVTRKIELPEEDQPEELFPFGLYSFRLGGLALGQEVEIVFHLPETSKPADGWFKCDPIYGGWECSDWVQFDGAVAVLTLADGGDGDSDGVVNGVIVDPSGPAFAPPPDDPEVPEDPEEPISTPGDDGSGGGGGCFISILNI